VNERILIVDDEKGIVKTLTRILTDKGLIVDSSENSPDAMKKIESNVYDLFILDIKMAGFSGIDLLEKIRKIDPAAPVILITAYSDYDSLHDAIRLGAYDYIAKPFRNDRLLSIVTEALEKRYQAMGGKGRSALLERAMGSVLNKDYELKIQYDRLRRVSEEYRVLFEFAPFPVMILREDGQIIRVNHMFVEESGYEKRDVEGRLHMIDFVDEKDRDTVLNNHLKRLRNEDAPLTYKITGVKKDGTRVGITVNAVLIPSTRYTFVAIKMHGLSEGTGKERNGTDNEGRGEERPPEKDEAERNRKEKKEGRGHKKDGKGYENEGKGHKKKADSGDEAKEEGDSGKGDLTPPDAQRKVPLPLNDLPLPAMIFDITGDRMEDANTQAMNLFNLTGGGNKKIIGEENNILTERKDKRVAGGKNNILTGEGNKKFSEIFPAEFVDEVRKASIAVLQKGRHSIFSLPTTIGGSTHYLDLHMAHMHTQGSRNLMLIQIRDSTENVEFIKKLEKRITFFERIVDSLDEGIIIVDENWRLVYGNHRFFHIAHLNPEEAIDKSILEIMPEDVMEYTGILQHVPGIIANGVPLLRKRVDSGKDYMGYPLVMEVSYLLLPLPNGKRNVIIVLQNVGKTAYYEKRSEETRAQLEEANKRLSQMVQETGKELEIAKEKLVREEKLATLGQMAGGIAHELKQPLTVIGNALYLLNTICGKDEKGRKYLNMIKEEIDRATRIVSDIRDFGREKAPEFQSVDVKRLVEGALLRVERPEGIELEVDIEEGLPFILTDSTQISTAIENIVRNAVQAMSENEENPTGRIAVVARKENGRVRISFSDTGPGISEENLAKIFQPLFTTKKKGMGLGLALVKDLVEKNGGAIEVESEYGNGSTFTLSFPVPAENTSRAGSSEDTEETGNSEERGDT